MARLIFAIPHPNPLLRKERGPELLPPSPFEGEGLGVRYREDQH
jgi:hypothetical protein